MDAESEEVRRKLIVDSESSPTAITTSSTIRLKVTTRAKPRFAPPSRNLRAERPSRDGANFTFIPGNAKSAKPDRQFFHADRVDGGIRDNLSFLPKKLAEPGDQPRIPQMDFTPLKPPWPGNRDEDRPWPKYYNQMKPKYPKSTSRNASGILLASSITLCLAGMASAANLTFNGAANDGNWNNTANWTTAIVPVAADNAGINNGANAGPNITTAIAINEFWVGTGAANTGSATLASGGTISAGAWTVIGRQGATGTFNQTGGVFNQNGQHFIVGSDPAANATFNQTGGTLNISDAAQQFKIAENAGSTGAVVSSGTINLVKNAILGPGTGSFTLNAGGTLSITGNANGNGEFQIGQGATGIGTFTQNGGTVTVNNWVSVGRGGGQGTMILNGGSFTKNANGSFLIGDNSQGTLTQTAGSLTIAAGDFKIGAGGANTITATVTCSGGLLDVQAGRTQLGENGSPVTTMTLSGTAEHRTNAMIIGAATTTATFSADGGILKADSITGGAGTANANFNGTQIIAKMVSPTFIADLDTAVIQSGGLRIDSSTFSLTVPQAFSGSGDIVKTGTGTLNLMGASTHTGDVLVEAGTVSIGNQGTGGTDYTIANNASLSVISQDDFTKREMGALTLGTSGPTTLNFDLGTLSGNTFDAPLSATSLAVNGTVTVNIADQNIDLGTIPLLEYTSKSGSGNFVLGTLPTGVIANIVDNGLGVVSLNVTALAQPKWDATDSAVWDTTTVNWLNGGSPSTYSNGNTTQFDDGVSGETQGVVILNTTVTPAALTFDNSLVIYSLDGTGSISGTTGLVKKGSESLTLGTLNGYTGVTDLRGGITSIDTVANAGAPSSIGAASASPANLLFSGGSLNYTGPAAATDRGFTLAAVDTTLITGTDLTIAGEVSATGTSNLIKAGNGSLILSGATAKAIGTVNKGLRIHGGGVTFNGTGTNTIAGEVWVGGPAATGNTSLTVSNATLTTGNWIAIGPENGTTNLQADVTFTNSTVTTTGGGVSLGYANGLFGYLTTSSLTLNNSTFTGNTGNFAESDGATGVVNVNGTSALNLGQANIGMGTGATSTMTVKDTTTTTVSDRLFIAQANGSTGTLNVENNATVAVTGDHEIQIGIGGQGTFNQSGGTVSGSGWMSIGRGTGGTGELNLTGGTFTQAGTDRFIHVGEVGAGTLNISGTGSFVALSTTGVLIADTAESSGVINLDGGSLTTTAVVDAAAGTSTFNFNGGQLIAGTGANAIFMNGIDTVTVKAGGAKIDSNGSNITINPTLLAGTGNGGLVKSGAGTLTLAGANTYTGNTAVNAGGLALADNAQFKFVIGANGVNNAVTGSGSGSVQLDGDFNIDTSGASTTSGNSWSLVNVGALAETYGGTFSVIGFANNSGVWTKTDGPNVWTYTQATGVLSVTGGGGGGYSSWATTNAGGQAPNLDFDGDGVRNGVEFFMGATGSGFTANPSVVGGQITWPKSAGFSGNYRVETSPNLVIWTDVTGSAVDNGTTVTYTLPTGSGKLFVHLVVIPN